MESSFSYNIVYAIACLTIVDNMFNRENTFTLIVSQHHTKWRYVGGRRHEKQVAILLTETIAKK